MVSGAPDSRVHRAKGRRTLAVVSLGTLALLMVSVLAYLGWANHLPPLPSDHRVLPVPNGYDACATAVTGVVADPGMTLSRLRGLDLTTADANALRVDLKQDEPALIALRKAIRMPYMASGSVEDRLNRSYLANCRRASRSFEASSLLALHDGEPGPAAESALDAMELGSRISHGQTVDWLVGMACTAMTNRALGASIERLSGDEAAAARRRLERILSQFPELSRIAEMRGDEERLGFRQVAAAHSVDLGLPEWIPNGVDDFLTRWAVAFYPKPLAYARLDTYWRTVTGELRKPLAARALPPPFSSWMTKRMTVDPQYLVTGWQQNEVMLRLARIELALQEFRQRHGREAIGLAELSIAAPETLRDPYDDRPMRYRRKGTSYVLYSIGPDRIDDGGKPLPMGRMLQGQRGDLVADTVILGHAPNSR